MPRPIVLVHGYSDTGLSFLKWKEEFTARGWADDEVTIVNYKSLSNEITIKDIAEAFDRALRGCPKIGADGEFDAIVHSTGMLVLRQWLVKYAHRRDRLKHLIGLAPATFGSPLAHKGRGFLGAVFKGNDEIGPDFMEVGDLVLDGLELGSRFTWDLTHADLLGPTPGFDYGADTPFAFVFCGTSSYDGLRALVNEPGTDGTVRWAGCGLNTQKIVIDLTREATGPEERFRNADIGSAGVLPIPFWPIAGRNHGTILTEPEPTLVTLVTRALDVTDVGSFADWTAQAAALTGPARTGIDEWQQFVVRALDERGDPIPDYYFDLIAVDGSGTVRPLATARLVDVHAYGADKSLRCFHVNLTALKAAGGGEYPALRVRVMASTGTQLVGYRGVQAGTAEGGGTPSGVWDAEIDLPATFGAQGVTLLYPFTTTFVELYLNRDPTPFTGLPNDVCYVLPAAGEQHR